MCYMCVLRLGAAMCACGVYVHVPVGCRLVTRDLLGSSNVGLGPRKKGSPFARGSSVDVRAWRIFDLFQHCINRAVGYNDA